MKKSTIIEIIVIIILVIIFGILIYFYINDNNNSNNSSNNINVVTSKKNSDGTYDLNIDNSKWNYDETNNVYYQIGLVYCANPETTTYETLGIYIPGDFMNGTKNSDGTYTCTINTNAKVGNYTSETAPIVMPINTAGYSAQTAPTSYSYNSISDYIEEGFIYVYAGCRGRNEGETDYSTGAPWGVTDLKAAVRYLRYNSNSIPANTENIFTFGHSGGGAQSSFMGATGDSELYYPYLESIGAIMTDDEGNSISDSVAGAMCWCPITNLDVADEAYEWNMGQFMTTGTRADDTFTKELSNDLANAYAKYINSLGIKDENGNILTLEESEEGIYLQGSYYDYVVNIIETSLNNFLNDTTFPYTPTNSFKADGGFGGAGDISKGNLEVGNNKEQKQKPDEIKQDSIINENSSQNETTTTYNSATEYIAKLNENGKWIEYDSNTNTAKIISLEGFIKSQKNATKDVGAFDSLDLSQAENKVFGNDNVSSLHFDEMMANILKNNSDKYKSYSDYKSEYSTEYEESLSNKDKLNNSVLERQNMYNPMYFISDYYNGYNTSTLAKYWRINTGITQGDTANVTEINLALALQNNSNVENVQFTTVWGLGHTTAERSGDSNTNFINWVNECLEN